MNAPEAIKTMVPHQSKDVDPKALLMLLVVPAGLIVAITIFTRWGLAAAFCFWFLFYIGLMVWSWQQRKRAKKEIRSQIERSGCKAVKMNYRFFRAGPFSLMNSSRSQHVYRVVVREATGRERIVWAQWGRRWFWNPITLELKWQDEASPK
jgi:uncharacterized protein (DUF58 family)